MLLQSLSSLDPYPALPKQTKQNKKPIGKVRRHSTREAYNCTHIHKVTIIPTIK